MSRVGLAEWAPAEILAAEERLHAGFSGWLKNHTNNLVIPIEYDRDRYPEQCLGNVYLEATPSLRVARKYGELVVGAAYQPLVDSFCELGIVDMANALDDNGQSFMVATGHYDNVLDSPITHNALFTAVNREEFAYRNGLMANMLMTRLGTETPEGLTPIMSLLRASGVVIIGVPRGPSAESHGVDEEIIGEIERSLTPRLSGFLKRGGVLHRAPTDTVAKPNGDSKTRIAPKVKDGLVNTIRKRTPRVVGVPMRVVKVGEVRAEVFEPRLVESRHDMDKLMRRMAETASSMNDDRIVYGSVED